MESWGYRPEMLFNFQQCTTKKYLPYAMNSVTVGKSSATQQTSIKHALHDRN